MPTDTPTPPPLRIAIVGAGGVGLVFGEALARSGVSVTFIARGPTLDALRNTGLTVDSPSGRRLLTPVDAHPTPEAIGPVDVVLIGVKAEQVASIAPSLRPLIGDGTVVVPLQNGVEASDTLAATLGEDHVAEGYCRMLAERTAPGVVRYTGFAPSIAFGPRPADALGAGARRTLERLDEACRAAGLTVERPADPRAGLWEKFLFVEPLGVLGAASRSTFGEMLALPATRATLEACLHEVMAVGRATGANIEDAAATRAWARYEALPGTGTASMHRDIVAGRPSELEAQTGAVVRIGRLHGVAVPVHETLYAALAVQEARARGT